MGSGLQCSFSRDENGQQTTLSPTPALVEGLRWVLAAGVCLWNPAALPCAAGQD